MKKINKIVPLALGASVATIVVPITTSCNSLEGLEYQEDLESLYTNGYERQIEALPASTVLTDPTTTYLETINKNPMLLADDVFDYEGNFPTIAEYSSNSNDAKGSIRVSAAKADVKNKTITYTKQLIVKTPFSYVTKDGIVIKAIVDLNLTIDVVALPVYVYGYGSFQQDETTYYYWYMAADSTALSSDDNWSITIDGKYNIDFDRTVTDGDISLKLTNEGDYAPIIALVTNFLPNVVCYFKNIPNE